MRHKLRGVRVDGYAYYVKKLRQNFGLETWIWRQIVTSQTAHTKYKWPSYATEWNPPHENFLRTPLNELVVNQLVITDCSFFSLPALTSLDAVNSILFFAVFQPNATIFYIYVSS